MPAANTYGGSDSWDDYDNRNTMIPEKKMRGLIDKPPIEQDPSDNKVIRALRGRKDLEQKM